MTGNVDHLHYLGTHQGHRINRMHVRINELMVSECTMVELADAITKLPVEKSEQLRQCFSQDKSNVFFQLLVNMMSDYYREQARKVAEELAI